VGAKSAELVLSSHRFSPRVGLGFGSRLVSHWPWEAPVTPCRSVDLPELFWPTKMLQPEDKLTTSVLSKHRKPTNWILRIVSLRDGVPSRALSSVIACAFSPRTNQVISGRVLQRHSRVQGSPWGSKFFPSLHGRYPTRGLSCSADPCWHP
jgi:hypothetical protein